MENISKIVLSQNQGQRLGYVLDVALDADLTLLGYYVADEETEGEYLIKLDNILKISSNYILVEDSSKLEFVSNRTSSLIGLDVLDENCLSYGQIVDLKFKKNKCEKLVTTKCELLPKMIKTVGENVVFVETKKRRKKQTFEKFSKTDLQDVVVKVQSVTKPEKINLSTSYYLGKVCLQDIFGYNNERLISKNDIVTRSMVEKARLHNKLNQLFFALKRD